MQIGIENSTEQIAESPSGMNFILNLTVSLLLAITFASCSSAKSNGGTGTIRGVVEQVLHAGARGEEGEPTRTISAVHGARVIVHRHQTDLVDSTTTDMAGRFEFHLPQGEYFLSVRPPDTEGIATNDPPDRRVEIASDTIVELSLRYEVYAP